MPRITLDGEISELIAFENIVPTGMEVSTETNTLYMTEAGAVPHLPEDGKVITLDPDAATTTEVASGVRLPVDIEYGCCGILYVLGQGEYEEGNPDAAPAKPNTGSLAAVNEDGTVAVLMEALNLPTSLEFIGTTAYIVTLDGEIWQIDELSR